tara:strand:- start:449 stop:796 length:348 start_codon:yes stop_codon:yes gene_type:complete
MTLSNLKTFLIVFLAVLLGIVLFVHSNCYESPLMLPEIENIESQQKELQLQQENLLKEILKHQKNEQQLMFIIDSLVLEKQNIKIRYVEKLQIVDTLPPNLLVKEFNKLFANAGL